MGTYVVLEVMCLELIDAMHYAHPAASQPLPLTVGLQNTGVRLEIWRAPLLQWSPSCHVTSRHRTGKLPHAMKGTPSIGIWMAAALCMLLHEIHRSRLTASCSAPFTVKLKHNNNENDKHADVLILESNIGVICFKRWLVLIVHAI